MKKINVVHICSSLDGGAGLCAKRIIQSTSNLGINNYVLVKKGKKTENIDIVDIKYAKGLLYYIQKLFHHFHLWPKANVINYKILKAIIHHDIYGVFTSPLTEYRISEHQWISEADIIHIHWVGGFLDYESFFKTVRKPIVWTMHDENAGLGGFHYELWKNMSTHKGLQIDHDMEQIKKKAYGHVKSMQIVAISSMMKDFITSNTLLRNFPCTLIHNGIDENQFTLIERDLARDALGINKDKLIFLFAAYDVYEDRKGLKVLINALNQLNSPNMTLICLGNYIDKPQLAFETMFEGFISHPRLLSLYYSSADFFVMPSFQEAFAQTPMEAMACGTPVIAFPCSGVTDLIKSFNGVVCKDFTKEALYESIKYAMTRHYDRNKIRNDVIERFSYRRIAKQYVQLYEELLK